MARWRSGTGFHAARRHFILRLIVFQRRGPHQGDVGSLPSVMAIGRSSPRSSALADAERYRASAPVAGRAYVCPHFHAVDADVLLAEVIRVERTRETTHALSR